MITTSKVGAAVKQAIFCTGVVWLCGCLDVWMSGCLVVWLYLGSLLCFMI